MGYLIKGVYEATGLTLNQKLWVPDTDTGIFTVTES